MVMPMSFAPYSCERLSFAGLLCVFAVTLCAGILRAQDALPPDSPSPPAPAPESVPAPALTPSPTPAPANLDAAPPANSSPSIPGLKPAYSSLDHGPRAPRNTGPGFSFWESSPFDAIHQGGARSSRSSTPGDNPGSPRPGHGSWGSESGSQGFIFQGTSGPSFGPGQGFGGAVPGMNGARGPAPGALKLDQLTRADLGIYMKSSMGNFRFTYQDALGARRNNLGGGVGQGSAGATFNSSTFGNGIFNLSATSTLGSGSMSGSSRGGFSVGPTSGAGRGSPATPGSTEKHPAASVSLHLHF